MNLRLIALLAIPPLILLFGLSAAARTTSKRVTPLKVNKFKSTSSAKFAGGRGPASVAKSVRAVAVTSPTRSPASVKVGGEANRAVEIRGQSRTLSMMLVLKNSKDSINFIKVRKDYGPEIIETQY